MKGPNLVPGSSYETVGGLIMLVLEPAVQRYINARTWKVLTIHDVVGGPPLGSVWDLNEYSSYHKNAKIVE